ncbi:hypothetical protein mRhiFer1_009573 [Rhinolophus ferrumequinum]|uniref:Uncharacterized protein n=1 Tax=Rhinolophus ferrumequinum TaxID=59479 RepID=A0A7J7ZRP9_RHIFE|nr:hypothetical protein mRhiFer1_009573 [Rhinolophus ferrumequinum]
MSIDSSGQLDSQRPPPQPSALITFKLPTPSLRLLNQPISGAPGPRGGPLPCQPLLAYAPGGRIAMATPSPDKLRADALRPPRRSGKGGANGWWPLTPPPLSCPGGLGGPSPSALRPLWPAPPAWRGGSQSPLWPGLWKRQVL